MTSLIRTTRVFLLLTITASLTLAQTFDPAKASKEYIHLNGQIIALENAAPVTLSTTSLAFGNQSVGTTSASLSVTLTNHQSQQVSGISVTPPNGGDFNVTNGCGDVLAAGASCSISVTFAPQTAGSQTADLTIAYGAVGSPQTVHMSGTGVTGSGGGTGNAPGLSFVPIAACRVVDTRNATGELSGPTIPPMQPRDFVLSHGACGIPANAQAFALNVGVIPAGILGFLNVVPKGAPMGTSILNSDGRVKSVAAIVAAGTGGAITVNAGGSNSTDLILDVEGYFVPAGTANSLASFGLGAQTVGFGGSFLCLLRL